MSAPPSAELPGQLIARAGAALSRARALLLQPVPRNLDIACSALATAIAHITDLQTVLTASPACGLTAAVAGLRKEVDLVGRLLEQAASYHVNLIECMINASGSDGQQARRMEPARHMSLEA